MQGFLRCVLERKSWSGRAGAESHAAEERGNVAGVSEVRAGAEEQERSRVTGVSEVRAGAEEQERRSGGFRRYVVGVSEVRAGAKEREWSRVQRRSNEFLRSASRGSGGGRAGAEEQERSSRGFRGNACRGF